MQGFLLLWGWMFGFWLVLALILGSFLNVCIARLPRHQSVVRPGSHCPRCGFAIRARDNIPVLSWLWLRGRCRACGLPISPRYPLVELGYAGLAGACALRFGFTAAGVAAAAFCFLVLGLLVMDLETMLLPDAFTLPGTALGLIWAFVLGRLSSLGWATLVAGTWALGLLAIRWTYFAVRRRHGIGLGDVKLVAMLGAWLGWGEMAVCFFFAVVAAALVGVLSAALSQSAASRMASPGEVQTDGWGMRRLPFGTFLCGAALFSLFYGQQVLTWYLSFYP